MPARRLCSRFAAGLLLLSPALFAQERDAIGIVLAVKGEVQARAEDGALRSLARRSEVFESDTVLVGADGSAQLKLVDDAMLALKSNTEFTFNSYAFDGDTATPDEAVMTMLRGGFRTISGSIGEEDHDSYRLDTPMASMGIRGTVHEGLIVGDVLYTAVYEGGTTVSNNAGSIDTGIGGQYDFAMTRAGEEPQGVLELPPTLGQLDYLEESLDGGDDGENGGAGEEAAVGGEAGAEGPVATSGVAEVRNASGDNPGSDARAAVANQVIDLRTQEEIRNGRGVSLAAIPASDTAPDLNPVLNTRNARELTTVDSRGNSNAGGNSGGSDTGGSAGNGNSGGNSGGTDTGGSNGNGNSGGNSGGTGSGNSGGNSGGTGSGNSGGNSGGTGSGNSGGNSGGAGNGNSGGNSGGAGNGNSGGNSGGTGNGNSGGNGQNSGNTSALAALEFDAGPLDSAALVGWSGLNAVDIASLAGTFTYIGSTAAGVDDSGAALQAIEMSFDVDVAGGSGAISNGLLMVIDSRNNPWNTTFSGDIAGGVSNIHSIVGSARLGDVSSAIDGEITGMFAGSADDPAFVSGFLLQSGASHVTGQVLLGK